MINFDNSSNSAAVSGAMTVEDAEPLLRELLTDPGMTLDMQECTHVHAATLQVLMAMRPRLERPPQSGPVYGLLSAAGLLQRTVDPTVATSDAPPNNDTER